MMPHLPDTSQNAAEAEKRFGRGLDAMAAGQWENAVTEFHAALTLAPEHAEAVHGLMRALEETGRWDEALALTQARIAAAPEDVLAHTRLSIVYQRMGRIAEAEAAATRAKLLDWKRQLREGKEGEDLG